MTLKTTTNCRTREELERVLNSFDQKIRFLLAGIFLLARKQYNLQVVNFWFLIFAEESWDLCWKWFFHVSSTHACSLAALAMKTLKLNFESSSSERALGLGERMTMIVNIHRDDDIFLARTQQKSSRERESVVRNKLLSCRATRVCRRKACGAFFEQFTMLFLPSLLSLELKWKGEFSFVRYIRSVPTTNLNRKFAEAAWACLVDRFLFQFHAMLITLSRMSMTTSYIYETREPSSMNLS